MKSCNCKDWCANATTIDTALVLMNLHSGTVKIKAFKYCPWCGQELKWSDAVMKQEKRMRDGRKKEDAGD